MWPQSTGNYLRSLSYLRPSECWGSCLFQRLPTGICCPLQNDTCLTCHSDNQKILKHFPFFPLPHHPQKNSRNVKSWILSQFAKLICVLASFMTLIRKYLLWYWSNKIKLCKMIAVLKIWIFWMNRASVDSLINENALHLFKWMTLDFSRVKKRS